MSTSNIIQHLDSSDALGVDFGAGPSSRRSVEAYLAVTTVAVGDAVVFDNAQTGTNRQGLVVLTAPFNAAGAAGVVGIVLEGGVGTAASPVRVKVVTKGLVISKMAAGTAAGALLSCTTVAGTGTTVTTGGGAATVDAARAAATAYAVALDAVAAGVGLVHVL